MASLDKEALHEGYEEVRDDGNDTAWMVMSYEGKQVVVGGKGTDYEEFLKHFVDDQRLYGYVRVYSGDEMSKRAKFVFITWIGPSVGALQRAKVSVDKSSVQTVIRNFACEILANETSDVSLENVTATARKAGGANYGTGVRD